MRLVPVVESLSGPATAPGARWSSGELRERTIHRRAVEAVIWGLPLVRYDAMIGALPWDSKRGLHQIAYWSRPSTWRNQTITPDAELLELCVCVNTRPAGPMVIEVPPAGDAMLFGAVIDCWQESLAVVGPAGADGGKGGRYLLLPPGYADPIPDDYIVVNANTYQTYVTLRTVPRSWSAEDLGDAAARLKQVRLYPLSRAANPQPSQLIDLSGTLYDSTIPYDLGFFHGLDRMVQEEPFQTKDKLMIHWLESLGIQKGKRFEPDAKTIEILTSAVKEAKAWLDDRFLSVLQPYYASKQWLQTFDASSPEAHSTFETPLRYATDARAVELSSGVGAHSNHGGNTFHLIAHKDRDNQYLLGEHTYHLNVPASVPAGQFWSVMAYDLATAAVIRESPRISLSSFIDGVERNADGSVDVYFGPKAPEGKERNWIMTRAKGQFFVVFRFAGPAKPVFDKTWQLPDIEKKRPWLEKSRQNQ